MVRWTFDDDVDTTDGDLAQYGAGPVINVSDGVGNLHGLATLSVPDPPVYKPDPQMNQGNAVQGDMVSGRFCYTEDPSPSESANYEESIVCTQPQNATGAYARNDFNPAATLALTQPPDRAFSHRPRMCQSSHQVCRCETQRVLMTHNQRRLSCVRPASDVQ